MRINLSVPIDFLDALSAMGGIYYGDIKTPMIYAISTNSKECKANDLFFAINGKNHNGNSFIPEAVAKGAIPVGQSVRTFGVKAAFANSALLSLCSFYKKSLPKLQHSIAITGSVGKTTTKNFLKILSGTRYKTHATWENYNNDIGVSYTIFSADADTEVLITEIGMNHEGEIKSISSSVGCDTAVITKIGSAHIGNLGTIYNTAKAKLEIVHGLMGNLIIPKSEPLLENGYILKKHFSAESPEANVAVIKNRFNLLELFIDGKLESVFPFKVTAKHIRECLAASISAALELDLTTDEILKGISLISDEAFRHNVFSSSFGFQIFDDSYNSSYESIASAIEVLNDIKVTGHRHALIGDVLELGEMSYDIHYKIGCLLASAKFENLFLVGEHAEVIAKGATDSGFEEKRILICGESNFHQKAAKSIISVVKRNDIILVKASHGLHLNKIIELIK